MAWLIGSSVKSRNTDTDNGNDEFFEIPIANWKFVVRVVFDVIMLSVLAIVFGFIVDLIIPSPVPGEDVVVTVWLLLTQMVLATMIILIIEYIYIQSFGRSTSTFFVSEVLILLFFISQPQVFARVYMIAKKLFGLEIALPAFPEGH